MTASDSDLVDEFDDLEDNEEYQSFTERPIYLWLVLFVILGLILGSVSTAILLYTRNSEPGEHSADAGFLRDMSTHHAQAVEMAGIVYQRTEDPEIRTLAYDILTSQQAQIGIMSGWLNAWDLPSSGLDLPMTWMGHGMTGLMPGMATDEEIASLSTLPLSEMDREFLRLMIAHHEGGVDMAAAAVTLAGEKRVRELAQGFVTTQQSEILYMQQLLAARNPISA